MPILWRMKRLGMKPGLVGDHKGRYLALVILAEDPIDKTTRDLFFNSLREHKYNPSTKEVVFNESGVTLNVSALDQPETIELNDLTILFDTSQGLRTYVRYLGHKTIHSLDSESIIGLREGGAQSLKDIEIAFDLDLELRKGYILPQSFSVPGCPGLVRHENPRRLQYT